MRLAALVLALAASVPSRAGVWSRPDPTTLKFEGRIEIDEYARFAAVDGPLIREVDVDSPGGVTEAGIKIGLALAARDIKVVAVGQCLSSCANYLFVAGHRREIRRAVVGYHGNVAACFGGANRADAILDMKRQGLTDEDVRRNLERQDREIADEARLLRIMGVSQELFDRTCTDDKGMGDGKSYAFLLPKRATFEKYGLWGIVGEQDPSVIAALTWPYALD